LLSILSGTWTPVSEKNCLMPDEDRPADHIIDGEAKDQETIIRQRSHIEAFVTDTIRPFARSKLYWDMTTEGTFHFELHFWFK